MTRVPILAALALLLGACGSDVSKADVQEAVRASSTACRSASFATPTGLQNAPARLTCGADAGEVTAYYFASGDDFRSQRAGLAQPDVIAAYNVSGDQWLVTTDDRAAAHAVADALESKVVSQADFIHG